MNIPRGLFGALLAILATHTADAEIYRCQINDVVTYTDRPCVGGTERKLRPSPGPPVHEMVAPRERLQSALDARATRTTQASNAATSDDSCGEATQIVRMVAGKK
jgi:hypothetical protein